MKVWIWLFSSLIFGGTGYFLARVTQSPSTDDDEARVPVCTPCPLQKPKQCPETAFRDWPSAPAQGSSQGGGQPAQQNTAANETPPPSAEKLDLLAQIEQVQSELANLQDQKQTQPADTSDQDQIAELKANVDEQKKQVAELEKSLSATRKTRENLSAQRSVEADQVVGNERLNAADLDTRIEIDQGKLTATMQQIFLIKQKDPLNTKASRNKIAYLTKQMNNTQTDLNKLRAQLLDSMKKIRTTQKDAAQSQKKIRDNLDRNENEIKDELSAAKDSLADAQAQLADAQAAAKEASESANSIDSQIKEKTSQLASLKKQAQALR